MNVHLTKQLFGFTMVDVEERKTIYRECENLSVFQKAFLQILGDTIRPRFSRAFWHENIYMWVFPDSWGNRGVYLAESGDAMYFDDNRRILSRLNDVKLDLPKSYGNGHMMYVKP